jgi:uncharacterized protein YbaR (Trm112 family)
MKKNRICSGELSVQAGKEMVLAGGVSEIVSGTLVCESCRAQFPILSGVAVVVPEPYDYLLQHVKGVSRWVRDADIPRDLIADFTEARAEIESEHIEEDLEARKFPKSSRDSGTADLFLKFLKSGGMKKNL